MKREKVLALLIFLCSLVTLSCKSGCFTWDLRGTHLQLVFRTSENTKSSHVVICDNKKLKVAECSFPDTDCKLFQNDIVFSNVSDTKVFVILQRQHFTDYDGIWQCEYNSKVYTANVSSSSGIINDISVQLDVIPFALDKKGLRYVSVKCSTCRSPYGNNAEFLINNISRDSITYHSNSGTCYHQNGPCNPGICNCSSQGNEFTMNFVVNQSTSNLFSCIMMFVDKLTGGKIAKIPGMYMDKQGMKAMKTMTKIIIPGKIIPSVQIPDVAKVYLTTQKYDQTKLQKEQGPSLVWVGFVAGLLLVLIPVIIVVACWLKKSKGCWKSNELAYPRALPMDEITQTLFSSQETLENKRRWLLAGYMFHEIHKIMVNSLKEKFKSVFDIYKGNHYIDQQTSAVFLEKTPDTSEKILNYRAVNENFCTFGDECEKYRYSITDEVSFSKLFLSSNICCYKSFDNSLGFESLMDLIKNCHCLDLPEDVQTSFDKIYRKWTRWYIGGKKDWTEKKLGSLIVIMEDIRDYLGVDFEDAIFEIKGKGVQLFTESGSQGLIGEKGKELTLFLQNTAKNHLSSSEGQIYALLKGNTAYEKFLKTERIEKRNISKLTKLIIETGMFVVNAFINKYYKLSSKNDIHLFLNHNKHQLFHTWHNRKKCCQCNTIQTIQRKKCELTREQFITLFCVDEKKPCQADSPVYCICNINAGRDVTLKNIDFTIALCIILHCASSDATINDDDRNAKRVFIQGLENMRHCRNKVFPLITTEYKINEYKAVWETTETTLESMSSCLGSDFQNRIQTAIQNLKSEDISLENTFDTMLLRQCEQDIILSVNQDCEDKFCKQLDSFKQKTTIEEEKSEALTFIWQPCTGELKLDEYQLIPQNEDLPIQVIFEVRTPSESYIDRILEAIQRKVTEINQRCSYKIVDTTLEDFSMIVNIPTNVFTEEESFITHTKAFFQRVNEACDLRLSKYTDLKVSFRILGKSLDSIFKPRPPHFLAAQSNVGKRISERGIKLNLIKHIHMEAEDYPFFLFCSEWSDKEFVFIKRKHKVLILYDIVNTKPKCEITLESIPNSIQVLNGNQLAMTFPEKKEIRICYLTDGFLSENSVLKTNEECYEVAKLDENTILVSIKKYGILVCNIKNKELRELAFDLPKFEASPDELFCFSGGRLVHTCLAKQSLYCYNMKGECLWSVKCTKHPTAITSDALGNVFVTDFASSDLYHIPPDGQSYNMILSKRDKLLYPSSIHFCERRQCLLIVNRDSGDGFCYKVV